MSAMTHFVGNEVTVDTSTGEAYISQRKLASELGIHHSSLQQYLATRHSNCMISEGIPSKVLQETAIHFAYKSKAANSTAEAFAGKIMEAGAKAYLYHEAGYVMEAKKSEPELSLFDSLAAGFARMAQVEREQVKQNNMLLELQERTNAVESRQSAILDQSSYFSVLAYAINKNVKITTGQASGLSRKCGNLSTSLGFTIGNIVDPRFGTVKTYHETILHEAFTSKGYITQ